MSRPLNVAPDVDDEDAGGQDDVGPKFLRDFDSEKEKVKTALLESKEEHDVQKPIKQSTPETEDSPGTKNTLGEPKEKADVDIRSGVSEQSETIDTLKEETGDVKQGWSCFFANEAKDLGVAEENNAIDSTINFGESDAWR